MTKPIEVSAAGPWCRSSACDWRHRPLSEFARVAGTLRLLRQW